MSGTVSRLRFRFSLGTLMIVVAIAAFLLVPAVWIMRLEQERRRAVAVEYERAHRAELEAQRAHYVASLNLAQSQWTAAAQTAIQKKGAEATGQPKASALWAMISVNHPAFALDETKNLTVEFTLVNDGQNPIDPKIGDSRILIDGKELEQSSTILGQSAPKDAGGGQLAPGKSMRFSCVLGRFFQEPGIYRITWVGPAFRSPDVAVRVLTPERPGAGAQQKR